MEFLNPASLSDFSTKKDLRSPDRSTLKTVLARLSVCLPSPVPGYPRQSEAIPSLVPCQHLTIAIAKERAIESLVHTGEKFVLNILAESNHKSLMRHFLKTFGPGEDRFAGIATQEAENGCPIISDGLAYLECSVENRLECGDHWVIYAVVENGKLLDTNGITAIRHRKSGSHY